MNKFLKIVYFLPLMILSACMVGPDFEKPEYMLDRKFSASQMSGVLKQNPQNLSAKDLAEWWKLFGDDDLTWLIEEALKSNFDLETARARVEQARATLAIRKSGFWPSAD